MKSLHSLGITAHSPAGKDGIFNPSFWEWNSMTQPRIALTAFVKTPGLSPIKTRLSQDLGEPVAAKFYRLAVDSVEATLSQVASDQLCPYWAVAEESGVRNWRWKAFSRVPQGQGGLGDRLGRVVNQLQMRHDIVAVMGIDSPQVGSSLLQSAFRFLISQAGRATHVLGRCHDGGFYFLATNRLLPRSMWSDIDFSSSETAYQLANKLDKLGTIVELPTLTDVDRAHDLSVLRRELEMISQLTDQQCQLLDWLAARERSQVNL